MILDFVNVTFEVWKMLLKQCSDQERRVYMSLYYQSNLYTCETHVLAVADIAKHAEITDKSAVYRILRSLVKKRFIRKLTCNTGLKYKFLHHVPKSAIPKSDIDWLA